MESGALERDVVYCVQTHAHLVFFYLCVAYGADVDHYVAAVFFLDQVVENLPRLTLVAGPHCHSAPVHCLLRPSARNEAGNGPLNCPSRRAFPMGNCSASVAVFFVGSLIT